VLSFWIEADSFMRRMVRIIVGSMLAVARGRFEVEWFVALLAGAPRSAAGETAPAQGLYLDSVRYPSEASR
jgi:tRNA pseudouridine38-40 synthase